MPEKVIQGNSFRLRRMTETKDALPALTDVTHVDVLVAEPSLQGDPVERKMFMTSSPSPS
jgi:hypothetical protein